MKISLVQYSPEWEKKENNKKTIKRLLNSQPETDLLIFPEMTLTGFTMNSELFSESLRGESFQFFSAIAAESNAFVAAGIIENDGGSYFNTLLLLNTKGSLVSRYRKIHPFSYSSEDRHYSAGSTPAAAEIKGWMSGLSICYDLRFPELYRSYGKQRVSLIINIANWPDSRIRHWNLLLKARAIENQCFVAAVNRIGSDPKLSYPGSSLIIDPMGDEVLCCEDREGVFTADIDMHQVEKTRNKFPFLNDIRLI